MKGLTNAKLSFKYGENVLDAAEMGDNVMSVSHVGLKRIKRYGGSSNVITLVPKWLWRYTDRGALHTGRESCRSRGLPRRGGKPWRQRRQMLTTINVRLTINLQIIHDNTNKLNKIFLPHLKIVLE